MTRADRPGTEPPAEGEQAPDAVAPLCDGGTIRPASVAAVLSDGGVLAFVGPAFGAVAANWWGRLARAGWGDLGVPVVGASRDGPYAQNAFIRRREVPVPLFADVDGAIAGAYGLLSARRDAAGPTGRRAVFVLDDERRVRYRWLESGRIEPLPREEIEQAVDEL